MAISKEVQADIHDYLTREKEIQDFEAKLSKTKGELKGLQEAQAESFDFERVQEIESKKRTIQKGEAHLQEKKANFNHYTGDPVTRNGKNIAIEVRKDVQYALDQDKEYNNTINEIEATAEKLKDLSVKYEELVEDKKEAYMKEYEGLDGSELPTNSRILHQARNFIKPKGKYSSKLRKEIDRLFDSAL